MSAERRTSAKPAKGANRATRTKRAAEDPNIQPPVVPIPDEPFFQPRPHIQCGDGCEFIFWGVVDESDLTVLRAERCTQRLDIPEDPGPISSGDRGILVRALDYDGFKSGSCITLDTADLPRDVRRALRRRFLNHPGELMYEDECFWPCQCVPDRQRGSEAAGQGESTITIEIDYQETVAEGTSPRGNRQANDPPPVGQIIGDDGKPVPFDRETDVLDLYGLGNTWQIWHVVRRYRVFVNVKIKYQATRVFGKCKELVEV